jgi:hypothetical protein
MFTVADCRVDLEGFHYRNRWEWVAEGVRISNNYVYKVPSPRKTRVRCGVGRGRGRASKATHRLAGSTGSALVT